MFTSRISGAMIPVVSPLFGSIEYVIRKADPQVSPEVMELPRQMHDEQSLRKLSGSDEPSSDIPKILLSSCKVVDNLTALQL